MNSLKVEYLRAYVSRQLENSFPTLDADPPSLERVDIDHAFQRTTFCISKIKAIPEGEFDFLNSGHFTTFLYFLSRAVWMQRRDDRHATRIFLLNKMLNGIDLFYQVVLPDVFLVGHTVGMVFAKAQYGERCVFHQGCTVGRNGEDRPTLGRNVVMYPHSSIIGRCTVGDNTVIAPGVQVVNRDIPGDCYVFAGSGRDLTFKPLSECYADRYFRS